MNDIAKIQKLIAHAEKMVSEVPSTSSRAFLYQRLADGHRARLAELTK